MYFAMYLETGSIVAKHEQLNVIKLTVKRRNWLFYTNSFMYDLTNDMMIIDTRYDVGIKAVTSI